MAEASVPESTILALAGYINRAMVERHSQVGMAAKREAMETRRLNSTTLAEAKIGWGP